MAFFQRYSQPLAGFIGVVLVLSLGTLGIKAALGAYADDYALVATVDRAGFGLDQQSTVKVRGITVGSVDGIELLDDHTVQVTLKIRKEIRIPTTVSATVEPLSVFGPKFVNLDLGAGEGVGPYLEPGDHITETVAPSEVVETLEKVARIIDVVDEDELASILTEFGRGFDGLGDDFGHMLDNTTVVADRALANQELVDRLLADARVMAELFADRGDDFVEVLDDSAVLLDTIAGSEDVLGQLLVDTSEMSTNFASVLRAGGDDLSSVIQVLDPVTSVLYSQLDQVPGLLQFTEDIFVVLADDVLEWEIGDGRLGGRGLLTVELDTCVLLQVGC